MSTLTSNQELAKLFIRDEGVRHVNTQAMIRAFAQWLDERRAAETEVARPQLEWEVTYDVVAYNESWGGYGDNASKAGFQSAEEAIAYAKPLGEHLNATVWQRTKPQSVTQPPSIKIWPAEKATGNQS